MSKTILTLLHCLLLPKHWLGEVVQNGEVKLAHFLLTHGANPNQYVYLKHYPLLRLIPPDDETLTVAYHVSPLYLALKNKNHPIIQLLLKHGADPAGGLKMLTQKREGLPALPDETWDSSCWDVAKFLGDEQVTAWLEEGERLSSQAGRFQ